jgi:Zn-dependent oligopeptidase
MSKSKKYVLNETPAVKQAIQNIEDAIKAMREHRNPTGSRKAIRNLEQALHTLKDDPISKIRFRRRYRDSTNLRPIDYYIKDVIEQCGDDIKLWGLKNYKSAAKNKRNHYSVFMMLTIAYTKDVLKLMRDGSIV